MWCLAVPQVLPVRNFESAVGLVCRSPVQIVFESVEIEQSCDRHLKVLQLAEVNNAQYFAD